jgi:hypothetical protein
MLLLSFAGGGGGAPGQAAPPHFQVALAQQRLDRVVLQLPSELQDGHDLTPPRLDLVSQTLDLLLLRQAQRRGLPAPQLFGVQRHVLGLLREDSLCTRQGGFVQPVGLLPAARQGAVELVRRCQAAADRRADRRQPADRPPGRFGTRGHRRSPRLGILGASPPGGSTALSMPWSGPGVVLPTGVARGQQDLVTGP